MQVLAELKSPNGMAIMHSEWKEKHANAGLAQEAFMLNFLAEKINSWNAAGRALDSLPIVISGMASSTIGIRELRYADIPYPASGSAAITEWIPAAGALKQPVLLVSGVRTADDVMRGEETQLIGLLELINIDTSKSQLFIFPGTHSKHIDFEDGQMTGFNTYMTGELFALISKQSILANSIAANKKLPDGHSKFTAFRQGVLFSMNNNLLHTLFTVRTNQLFQQLKLEENYYYLSGLIVGAELTALQPKKNMQLVLAGEAALVDLYKGALETLGLDKDLVTVPGDMMDKALIAGQRQLLKTHSKEKS